jgi:vacuolar-type H+-ATPase subunit F/Vma7
LRGQFGQFEFADWRGLVLRIVAIGTRAFVAAFELAGSYGVKVQDSDQALAQVKNFASKSDVCLILVSDDLSGPIHDELTEIRTRMTMPLIYEVPAPGASKMEKVEYGHMLTTILGV